MNNRVPDLQEKFALFCDFQYGFRFSQSTVNLLTVVSDRIDRVLTGLVLLEL